MASRGLISSKSSSVRRSLVKVSWLLFKSVYDNRYSLRNKFWFTADIKFYEQKDPDNPKIRLSSWEGCQPPRSQTTDDLLKRNKQTKWAVVYAPERSLFLSEPSLNIEQTRTPPTNDFNKLSKRPANQTIVAWFECNCAVSKQAIVVHTVKTERYQYATLPDGAVRPIVKNNSLAIAFPAALEVTGWPFSHAQPGHTKKRRVNC